jgi:pimeloyl-ACP methyl ester carboxylesterase
MDRLVLVHGSVTNGATTWRAQAPLADRYRLVVLDRPGFPPGPPVERVDFDADAAWLAELLEPGDHLVGHSYGGVVTLLAAALRPDEVGSLTVIEPPCLDVARGNPVVDAFVAGGKELRAAGPSDPEEYLRLFMASVGAPPAPSHLPPALLAGARVLMAERPPWEARIPLAALAAAPFPTLVVSGGHSPALDAVCNVLEQELGAQRAVLPGAGHAVQRLGAPFNLLLDAFVRSASNSR